MPTLRPPRRARTGAAAPADPVPFVPADPAALGVADSIPRWPSSVPGSPRTGGGSGSAAPCGGRGTSWRPSWSWSSCWSSRSGSGRSRARRSSPLPSRSLGLLVLLVLVVRARPSLGETALAVDAESGSGDAIASALAFAGSMPETATAGTDADTDETIVIGDGFDLHDAEGRFVRRQRRDALARLRVVEPGLFRPRLARRPALVALVAAALVLPAALLPNPQDAVIAQNRQVREEAAQQAERIDEVAKDLEGKGADANDPRSQLAEELRELAEQLRQNPGDLDANLAQLGAVEDDVRAQLNPANEQRAAAIAALSRSLSRHGDRRPEGQPGRRSQDDARGPRQAGRGARRDDPGGA